MDWSRLERDMKYQTASILQSKPRQVVAYEGPPTQSFRSFDSDTRENKSFVEAKNDIFDNKRNDEMWNEMQELRSIVLKQNDKLRRLEDMIDLRDTNTLKFETIQQRIEQLESDIQSCVKLLNTSSRENADFVVQTKSINGRLHWVEDMVRTSSQDFVSKASFSQFLDTCTDQLKTMHTSTEAAHANSTMCITFIEALLAAFSQLQGSQQILGLEYLVSLSGERQRGQIVQHLREALNGAILREVEAGCRGVHSRVSEATSDIRKDVSSAMNEIKEQIVQHGQAMADEVCRSADSTNKSLVDSSKQMERLKQRLEAEINSVKEAQQVADIDQADLRQEVQKSVDATTKIVAVTIPTAQRNHKALLDEVLRLEELAGDLINRMEQTESDNKHMQRLHKQITAWQEEKDVMLSRCAEAEGVQSTVPPLPPTPAAPTKIDSCEKCKDLGLNITSLLSDVRALDSNLRSLDSELRSMQPRVSSLEEEISTVRSLDSDMRSMQPKIASLDDVVGRLAVTARSLESGMDALQAEFSMVYDDAEKRKTQVAENDTTVAVMKSDIIELKVKLSNIPLEVFPQTSIQTAGAGARAGLTGLSERIKHSAIASGGTSGGDMASNNPTEVSSASKPEDLADSSQLAQPMTRSLSNSSLPPIHSPESRHVTPLDVSGCLDKDTSSDEDSYNISESDDSLAEKKPESNQETVDSMQVVTATVTTNCVVSSDSDSSFEKSELEESACQDEDQQPPADRLRESQVKSDVMIEFNEEDMLDEDDESVDLSTADNTPDMRETSRIIEDSLDESIQNFDEDHKNLVHSHSSLSPGKEDLSRPPVRMTRNVVKLSNSSKYETHKAADKRESPSGEITQHHPDADKHTPSHSAPPAAAPSNGGPKIVVDSLGNIVSSRSRPVGVVSESVEPPKTDTSSATSSDSDEGKMKGPSTAILSGSLLGSRGRNKGAPLQSSSTLPSAMSGPPVPHVPIPSAAHTRTDREDTSQCTFCLRRMGIEDLRAHMKVCELRTELCRFGCRSRIMVTKMDKHVAICPNNPANRDFT